MMIDNTQGNMGIEPNTFYNLRFLNAGGGLLHEVTNYTANSYTWAEVGLDKDLILMQFENSITDEAGNVWTATGNPSYTEGKVQNKAIRFNSDGNLTCLTSTTPDLNFAENIDFTIEFWLRRQATNVEFGTIIANNQSSWDSNCRFLMIYDNYVSNRQNGQLAFGGNGIGNANDVLLSQTALEVNTWYHVAITRAGSLYTLYINGLKEASYTDTINFNFGLGGTLLGRNKWDGNNGLFSGDIDQLRISRGALYGKNFTPTTEFYEFNAGSTLNRVVNIELEAVRDGLTSLQKHQFTIKRT